MSPTRFAVAAATALAVALPTRAADPPSGLAMMPASAVGFVHVRAQDVYKHDLMKGLRDTIAAAGPKARAAFDQQVYPSPATIEGLSVFMLMTDGGPQPVGVVAFTEAIDTAKVMKLHMPTATAEAVGGKTIYMDRNADLVAYFPDPKHVAVGSQKGMAAFVTGKPGPSATFAQAVKAAGTKAVVASVNVTALPTPKNMLDNIPPDFHPLLAAERATLTIDLSAADPVIEARLSYRTDADATEANRAVGAGAKMLKGQMAEFRKKMEEALYAKQDAGPRGFGESGELAAAVIALGAMNQAEALLDNPPITKAGTDLTASVTVPQSATGMFGVYGSGIGIGLLLPAVQKVREAAARVQGQNNMKQIGLAMHGLHDATGNLPPPAITDKKGKALLSWRVAILPYIEQDALYRRFKLDEPWDSEHNKKLIPMMPKTYITPRYDAGEGKTVYKVFVGKGTMFETGRPIRLTDITDGTSNTIMAVEGGEAVVWTKPDDIPFDLTQPVAKLALPNGNPVVNVLFGDGSVRSMTATNVDGETLKKFITRDGGEVADFDTIENARPGAVKPSPPIIKQ